jgi:sulfur-oxidizing protein SoxX
MTQLRVGGADKFKHFLNCFLMLLALTISNPLIAQTAVKDVITESLSGKPGDATKGRVIVLSRQTGLCILCHNGPFPEERFQGNLAPDLAVSAARLSKEQLRARIVDASQFNPDSIMPSYYQKDHFTRVAPQYAGKSILSAQDIEDVVEFLVSLKQ